MVSLQEKFVNRIRSLQEIDDVDVVVSEDRAQIKVSHGRHHVADFKLKWVSEKYYAGYFVDADGNESQAIVSIRTSMDAIKFAALYATLVDLSAMR